jgi:quercetin dioxygenase-like cupin family protein
MEQDMSTRRSAPQINPGVPQRLDATELGVADVSGFLSRFVVLGDQITAGAPAHVAVHMISGLDRCPDPYVHAHAHPNHDEIGIVVGQPGDLDYEIVLGDQTHVVSSPASIYIPAGTRHRARALRGNGAYICILMDPRGPRPEELEVMD